MLLFIMVVVWRLMEDEKAKIFCRRKMKDVSRVFAVNIKISKR